MFEPLEGGCLCGRLRYRVTLAPIDSGYCHCRMCQKSSGAPLQASAEIPIAGFAFIKGKAKAYRSSPQAVRHFCPHCGSQLTFRMAENPDLCINQYADTRPARGLAAAHAHLAGRPDPLVRGEGRPAALRPRGPGHRLTALLSP